MSEWQKRTLNELGDFMSGGGFPIIYQGETSGDYPFYKVSDLNNIGNESCLDRSNNYIHEDVRRKLGLKLIPQNSIVFAKIGAAVYLERKRIMIHNGLIDNNMAAFIGNSTTIEKLMYYIFQLIRIGNYTNTTALPAVDLRGLGHHEAYYPVDPKEQRRIAAVLTAADEAVAASRALVEKYTAVKQGLMQNLLVIGELTRLDKVCSYIIGGSTPNTHESKYWGGSNIWITPTDLSVLNSQYISNSERKLTDAGLKRATGKLVPANSIIISCRAPVGYCAVVTEPFSFNQGCKALVCKDVNPLFLYYQLSAAKNHLERFASGTTFLELPKKELERFRIHCPSLPEQQRIAEILTAADERLSAERERLRKLEDIKRGLMDDLLTNRVSTDKLQGGI